MPSANAAASPGLSVTRNRFCAWVMFIVAPTASRSSAAGQPVGDLHRRVLDDVGDEAVGDLLGDDETLAVGADLGQQPGEHLHRVCRRPGGGTGFLAAEQPVRLLDDGQAGAGRPSWPGWHGWPSAGARPAGSSTVPISRPPSAAILPLGWKRWSELTRTRFSFEIPHTVFSLGPLQRF